MPALLVLEDGFTLTGRPFAGNGEVYGEAVFNTSMTGYQEIITDPSYKGQLLALTHPMVGNYGVNSQDEESDGPKLEGLLVREYSPFWHNWRGERSLQEYLEQHQILAVEGIDTRALTRHIRRAGALKGVISTIDFDPSSLLAKLNSFTGLEGKDMTSSVTCSQITQWNEEGNYHVVAFDFGIKRSILRQLVMAGCRVTVVPATTPARDVLALKPDGIFLSNGPGDPAALPAVVTEIRKLLGQKPIFGICLGHQILGLALGMTSFKLKFGHRGGNHPVRNTLTGRVEVTTQNHGFCVAPTGGSKSLPSNLEISHVNLVDGTVEGISCPALKLMSVQFHPEAGPGPHDSHYLFKTFTQAM